MTETVTATPHSPPHQQNITNQSNSPTSNPNPTHEEELYPIALLMDELRHDDVASRVQAMQRLDTIALSLGPERTRNELLPFLEDVIPEDEDEVISVAATQLSNFVPLVGGPQFATILLPLLEKISACEEPIVRDNAVNSLNLIASSLSINQLNNSFIPLINRLSKERWFSLHIAATGLFKSVITRLNSSSDRFNLLNLYNDLIHDDSPLVRKEAAKNLPILINKLSTENLLNDVENDNENDNENLWSLLNSMLSTILNDNQDSIKFLSVDIIISLLSSNYNSKDFDSYFANIIILINDPSWRVRYMVSNKLDSLLPILNDNSSNYLLKITPNLINLMKDNEAEVRKSITQNLTIIFKLLKPLDNSLVESQLIPLVNQLSIDESEFVRESLALVIPNLSPILGKDLTINYLLPIFIEMLKDDYSNVRLNIISNLQIVNNVIGIQLLNESLIPAITSLANDKLWRIRLAIIEQIPLLANQLGISFFNNNSLSQLSINWLNDPVYSIRDAAVNNLAKLSQLFGIDWCNENVINKIQEIKSSKDFNNFITRLTCLFTFTKLIDVVDLQTLQNSIAPFIFDLSNDKVPNIRFNVAKSLTKLAKKLNPNDQLLLDLKSILQSLQNDQDPDVRFFATEGLNEL